jgi:hypothetical protein
MHDLCLAELETESVELLPSREVMSFFSLNVNLISARNRATAVQAVTALSLNNASANQGVFVTNF